MLVEPRNHRQRLTEVAREYRGELLCALSEHGALLFRGFANSIEQFSGFLDAVSDARIEYMYRSTPRESQGDKIYTATIYPADRIIPMHCENSYQRDWPMLITFCCVEPSRTGGETPLADARRVLERLPTSLVDEFRSRRICYVRYFRAGADLSWQDVFQTQDQRDVDRYCQDHGIEHEWFARSELRTRQVCQATAHHPLLGIEVWFNQAHLFHSSALDPEVEEVMRAAFGEERLPRHVTFGDGGAIDRRDLGLVRQAYDQESVAFQWRQGDVLLIDNMQVAHGRRPYQGNRLILAGMSNPYSLCSTGGIVRTAASGTGLR